MGWICRLCGTVNMGQARKCHKCHGYGFSFCLRVPHA